MSPSTDEVAALNMPDDETHDACRNTLADLVNLIKTMSENHSKDLKGLLERQTEVERALLHLQGDLGAIRGFMHSHNTALGELGQRFDRLACMTEPCEPQGNGQAEGSRKTPSTELKPL